MKWRQYTNAAQQKLNCQCVLLLKVCMTLKHLTNEIASLLVVKNAQGFPVTFNKAFDNIDTLMELTISKQV